MSNALPKTVALKASKLASQSWHPNMYHASIVIRGGAIVSTGFNTMSTHAEVMALRDLWPSERKGTKLWSIRVTPGGRFANARPCPECLEKIREAGVKMVYYTDDNGNVQKMKP